MSIMNWCKPLYIKKKEHLKTNAFEMFLKIKKIKRSLSVYAWRKYLSWSMSYVCDSLHQHWDCLLAQW